MTETLHHTPKTAEHSNHNDDVLAQLEADGFRDSSEMLDRLASLENTDTATTPTTETTPDRERSVSPTADRIRRMTERFAHRLETRAVSKAHKDALEEYRTKDYDGYVDHVAGLSTDAESKEARAFNKNLLTEEERAADLEELLDGARLQMRAIGSIALEKTVHAGKATGETAVGIGILGYKAAAKRARGARLAYQIKTENRATEKSQAKELKKFDKDARKSDKRLNKQSVKDIKVAAKDEKRFEREMRSKVRAEKRAEIKEKFVASAEKVAYRAGEAVGTGISTAERVYSSGLGKKRKLGAFALRARSAGQAAMQAGREELKK